MKMKKVRIGLLGAGRIGKLHGENLAHAVPEAELYAVADPFMNDATRAWAADMGIEKCYDDPEKIFNDPSIEAVFICSSTNTHAEFIMRAAKAGSMCSARSRSTPTSPRSKRRSRLSRKLASSCR